MTDELFIGDMQANYLAYLSISICTGSGRIR